MSNHFEGNKYIQMGKNSWFLLETKKKHFKDVEKYKKKFEENVEKYKKKEILLYKNCGDNFYES